MKGRDAFCSFDDEVCVYTERACGLSGSVWVEDDACAYLLVSCDGIVQGVEGVLYYNAREKKSLCNGSSIDGSEVRARYQSTVYREGKEESSITEVQAQPPSHSLLTSLPKRDDLTQSTQTSSRFLQLKHMFT